MSLSFKLRASNFKKEYTITYFIKMVLNYAFLNIKKILECIEMCMLTTKTMIEILNF
jgi:hypothetical protein